MRKSDLPSQIQTIRPWLAYVSIKPKPECQETIRVWVIGSFFAILGSGLNILFSMRAPTISISTLIAQLIAYPIGNLWSRWMPCWKLTIFGKAWPLNPGPFTIKEHTLITIMAGVSFSIA